LQFEERKMPRLPTESYAPLLEEITQLLEASRQQAARSVNAMTRPVMVREDAPPYGGHEP